MLGSFPRPPLRAHTRDPNGHSQVSPARETPHLPIDVQQSQSTELQEDVQSQRRKCIVEGRRKCIVEGCFANMRWGAGGVVTVISRVLWIVSIAACSSRPITGCGGLRRCPITGGELHVWT